MEYPVFDADVAANMAASPHARHMLAALVLLNQGDVGQWASRFVRECPCMPEPLKGSAFNPASSALLERGWIAPDTFIPVAQKLCSQRDPTMFIGGIRLRDVASPVLPPEIVASLGALYKNFTPVMAALSANPNWQGSQSIFETLPDADRELHLSALIKYGDMANPQVNNRLLREVVLNENEKVPNKLHLGTMQALCARDLPENLAKELALIVGPDGYALLCQTKAHRKLVKDGALFAHNYHGNHGGSIRISPEASAIALETLIGQLPQLKDPAKPGGISKKDMLSAVAAHDNSLEGWRVEARKLKGLMKYAQLVCASTAAWAADEAELLRQTEGIPSNSLSRMQNAHPRTLLALAENAVEYEDVQRDNVLLKLVSNKKFPWTAVDKNSPIRTCETKHRLAMTCCEALTAKSSSLEQIQKEPLAVLFTPTLTGNRISKIVTKNPELAAFAALHPNGDVVPLSAIRDENTRDMIARRREREVSLPGRSTTQKIEAGHVLSL